MSVLPERRASAAPQWVAGEQRAGALVFNAGYVYRVKQDIANAQAAPTGTNAFYFQIGYDDAGIYTLARSLGDRLDLLARFVIRWDLEKATVLNQDSQSSLRYTSGEAFAFTPGTYAAGIIQLRALDYGRPGDLIAVRIAAGSRDFVFNAGAAESFNAPGGPATIPALAGQQYIFHLVQPTPQQVTGSYWQVHSTPGVGGGGAIPGTARDPYDVPAAKRKAVVDTGLNLVLETDEAYYGKRFGDNVYGPDQPARYECMPFAPAQDGGATIWYWARTEIL